MTGRYTTKAALYQAVGGMRPALGIQPGRYPVNLIAIARRRCSYTLHAFDTPGLFGMCLAGPRVDSIVLSSRRSDTQRQFDCGHELVHLYLHRNLAGAGFHCFAPPGPKGPRQAPRGDAALEWEANAGAAELLVPMAAFLPLVARHADALSDPAAFRRLRRYLAGRFGTTVPVISLRFEELRYELQQYLGGTPLEEVEILSATQLRRRGVDAPSFNRRNHAPAGPAAPRKPRPSLYIE